MFLAGGFPPFQPSPGLALWSTIIFLLFWWIMSKYAFKPMMNGLKKREDGIKSALAEAQKAREEMANLKAENESILAEARDERAKMLKEAKETRDAIINEAKDKAREEANRLTSTAKMEIENEKKAAMIEVKNEVGNIATEIAEKILRKELKGNPDHQSYVNTLVGEMNMN